MTAPPESIRSPARLLMTRGDATAGIVVPRGQLDRLAVVLSFTAADGHEMQIELARNDIGRLAADLTNILAADADQLCRWWYRLSTSE